MARDLQQTLEALYDSEIHVTITWLWDGGIDFGLFCCTAAMKELPTSGYAQRMGAPPPAAPLPNILG
jgi:hypothetical protein